MADAPAELIDFEQLKLEQVIDESALYKSITFQATYKGQNAVVRLEKTPFEESSTRSALSNKQLTAQRSLINDIYSRYTINPAPTTTDTDATVNNLKAIIVLPANDTVMNKYSHSKTVFFSETAEIYAKIVEPFLANMLTNESNYNQWVYNILEGRSEADHVLYNDTDKESGFMLLPSLKSSGDDKELHVLAICHRRDIRSLRDLNETHLPLLKNIHDNGPKLIREKYPDQRGHLRSYVHYHPTFYHFHVHFELIDASGYKASDRDNLLITIINNISLMKDYYTKATLSYPLSQASALYKELDSKDLFSTNKNVPTKLCDSAW